jgi:hypothetical protein
MTAPSDIAIPQEKVVPETADADLPGRPVRSVADVDAITQRIAFSLPGPPKTPDACGEGHVDPAGSPSRIH